MLKASENDIQALVETANTPETGVKTLANCTPVEFLRQTNKIKYAVENYLKLTGAREILRRRPTFSGDETDIEKAEITRNQWKDNWNALSDVVLDTYAEQTAELIGLMCFMDKEQISNAQMITLLYPLLELIQNKQVSAFFQALLSLGQMNMPG